MYAYKLYAYKKKRVYVTIVSSPPFLKGGDRKSEKWPFAGGYEIFNIKGRDENKGGLTFFWSHEQDIFH